MIFYIIYYLLVKQYNIPLILTIPLFLTNLKLHKKIFNKLTNKNNKNKF